MARPVREAVAPEAALSTYRYLRVGLVAAVGFLITSVLWTRLSTGVPQDSVSAYYYTESHAVFIGALCAIGAGLIAYQGKTIVEDMLLNFAGFMAFVVAFVPTRRPDCPLDARDDCGQWLPRSTDTDTPISNNVTALLIAAAIGYLFFLWVSSRPDNRNAPRIESERPGWELALRVLGAVIVTAGVILLFTRPALFYDKAHGWAAIAMFVAITVVAIIYGKVAQSTGSPKKYTAGYTIAAALMIAGVIWALVALLSQGPIFGPEVLLIAGFAIFWISQTFDLWSNETKYDEAMQNSMQTNPAA